MSAAGAPKMGTCPACGTVVPLVNFKRNAFGPRRHGGYLARHTRPGTKAGTKCRGSFNYCVERSTALGYKRGA